MTHLPPVFAKSHLQNRIDPWGRFNSVTDRGAWMGNRGILHDDQKKIIKNWDHSHWVTCRLDYEGNVRQGATAREKLFTPGNYSELFFLDEATAFAAGHRPCSTCRNKRYKEFKRAWAAANREHVSSDDPPYTEMDKGLQRDRVDGSEKKTYEAPLESLPEGTMIEIGGTAFLIWRRQLWKWSFAGYEADKDKRSTTSIVTVLTPMPIVRMFANGFIPQVHLSAYY